MHQVFERMSHVATSVHGIWKGPSLGLRLEFVSDTVDGLDEVRAGIHGFDFPAYLLDVAVDGAVAYETVIRIDLFHDLLPPVNTARMIEQELKKFEFNRRELEVTTMKSGPVSLFV